MFKRGGGGKGFWTMFKTLPEAQRTQELTLWLRINSSTTWQHIHSCKFGHQMAPLALVTKLAARWLYLHWLHIWPPHCTTWTSYKVDHKWHNLHLLLPESSSWIGCKSGHQMALLALVKNLTTRLTGWVTCIATLPWIVLLALSVSIGLVSPSAGFTSVKFQKGVGVSDRQPDP